MSPKGESRKEAKKSEASTVPVKRESGTAAKSGELVRGWNPWRAFDELRSEIEELWRGNKGWAALPHLSSLGARQASNWLPSTDVYKSSGNLVVKADLPGLKKEDVEVSVDEGCLVVKGERREEKRERDKEYYRSECSYGSFYRRVPLPDNVDPNRISARVKDGVLEVTVPLPAAESKTASKKVQVT